MAIGALLAGPAAGQIKVHRHLRVEDGLVQSQVNSILEDSRGFVWLGTFGGVSRWDGRVFRNFQTQDGLSALDVRVIHELPDGTLLFGTGEGGISVFKNGTFETIDTNHGLPENSVRAILRNDDGSLMVATSKGIVVFADASFDTSTASYQLMGLSVSGLEKRRQGGFYASTFGDGVFVLENDEARPLDPDNVLPEKIVRAIHETTDGTLWISVYKNGLWLLENGKLRAFENNAGLGGNDVKAITPARDGTLYLSTLGGGIGVYKNGSLETITPDASEMAMPWKIGSKKITEEPQTNARAVIMMGRVRVLHAMMTDSTTEVPCWI